MIPLLMASAVLFGADDAKSAAPKVEGQWRIVYAEEGGRRNNSWEQKVATVRDNTLSYESEGKKRSLKLTFGPHQTVKAKGDHEFTGVYISGQDYLCVSLNDAKDENKGAANRAAPSFSSCARCERTSRRNKRRGPKKPSSRSAAQCLHRVPAKPALSLAARRRASCCKGTPS